MERYLILMGLIILNGCTNNGYQSVYIISDVTPDEGIEKVEEIDSEDEFR